MANKNETIEDIVGDIRAQNQGLPEDATALSPLVCDLLNLADRIEAAHKRELETKDSVIQTLSAARDDELDRHRREVAALKRRRSELNAEVSAKDAVIMRLDAEIRKYQEKRELRIAAQKAKAAAEGYADGKRDAQVGNAAKFCEAMRSIKQVAKDLREFPHSAYIVQKDANEILRLANSALAAPARNCDKYENDNAIEQFEREILGKEAATTYERLENMRENWFRYNRWLFEKAKESEAGK